MKCERGLCQALTGKFFQPEVMPLCELRPVGTLALQGAIHALLGGYFRTGGGGHRAGGGQIEQLASRKHTSKPHL